MLSRCLAPSIALFTASFAAAQEKAATLEAIQTWLQDPAYNGELIQINSSDVPNINFEKHDNWKSGSIMHSQGASKLSDTLFLTAVDEGKQKLKPTQTGALFLVNQENGEAEITTRQFLYPHAHVGGMDYDLEREILWLPAAVHKKNSSTIIHGIDPMNEELKDLAKLSVNDHIGTVISSPEGLFCFNWSSEKMYHIPSDSLEEAFELNQKNGDALLMPTSRLKSTEGPGFEYQDCVSLGDGYALCSGYGKSGINWWKRQFTSQKFPVLHLVRVRAKPLGIEIIAEVKREQLEEFTQDSGLLLTENPIAVTQEELENGKTVLHFYFAPHNKGNGEHDTPLIVLQSPEMTLTQEAVLP